MRRCPKCHTYLREYEGANPRVKECSSCFRSYTLRGGRWHRVPDNKRCK